MECCRQNLKEWLDLEPAKDENVVLSFSLELKRNVCNSMWYFKTLIKYILSFFIKKVWDSLENVDTVKYLCLSHERVSISISLCSCALPLR